MNDKVRMSKDMAECFVKKVTWNNATTEVLYVPLFGGKPGWVGPGYWSPPDRRIAADSPTFKYNSIVYTRDELLRAGATPKLEYLWMR